MNEIPAVMLAAALTITTIAIIIASVVDKKLMQEIPYYFCYSSIVATIVAAHTTSTYLH